MATRGDRARYSGLVTCGSVWACPVCSERIWAERAATLEGLLTAATSAGLRVAFVTLTMRHDAGMPLAESWDALAKAWTNAIGGSKDARAALKAAGTAAVVRRVEATWGRRYGWHPHAHALVVFEHGTAEAIGQAMHAAWKASLERNGRDSWRDAGGLDARELSGAEAAATIAEYATKGTYAPEAAPTAAHDLAMELAGAGSGKLAAGGNATPWGILDAARHGDRQAAYLWGEWESATKGRRALQGLPKLARHLGVELDDRTDEDIAADNDGDQEDVLVLPAEDYAHLQRHDGGRHVLALLEVVEGARPHQRAAAARAYVEACRLGIVLLTPGEAWARYGPRFPGDDHPPS